MVVGGDALAVSAFASLEADADVTVYVHEGLQALCEELTWPQHGQITILDWG